MYKMLIVDDFDIDRENIKDCLSWESIGIAIVGEAIDGKDALSKIDQCQPDFILTDVQMPFINGIELAEQVKSLHPEIKVIFMSYYNDFEYLKSAIDLNAHGYILKPFVLEEVKEVFLKLIKKADKDNRLKQLLIESKPLLINRFYKNLLLGHFKDEKQILLRANYLNEPLTVGYVQVIIVEIDEDNVKDNVNIEEFYLFNLKLERKLEELCDTHHIYNTCQIDDYHHVIIINDERYDNIIKISFEFLEELTNLIKSDQDAYTIGVSSIADELSKISILHDECQYALRFRFHYGTGQIINYEDISAPSTTPDIKLSSLQDDIKILISSSNTTDIDTYINQLFGDMVLTNESTYIRNITFGVIMCLRFVLDEFNISLRAVYGDREKELWVTVNEFKTIEELKEWLYDIIYAASRYYTETKNNKNNKIIANIKHYINENYMNDITVKEIASHFYYTPNYLNTLFKKEIGQSIPDYITEFRVNKAKLLLESSNLKIYEVIESVGYRRASHFNSIFKRYTGFTPSEFRGKTH
ncbi:response regulator [Vallitalea okinawensis]|uniref:response regulator n=1 Tax=Vallitalea okinawensis TaxID=2078660 RepID=UPI000CFADAC9|nr:response regulator [Vallitalea okinawensis]